MPPGRHCSVSSRHVVVVASASFTAILRARGDSDLGDGLRARGAEVPAGGLRRGRQLRPPARGLPDLRRRHVDRYAGGAGRQSGLDAEQVMMPVDHLLLPEAEALPAIVVMRLPSGLVHFVVVWRVHGPCVQVMDPARGRRWVRRETFLRDVYVHRLTIPAEAFREWAGSDGFLARWRDGWRAGAARRARRSSRRRSTIRAGRRRGARRGRAARVAALWRRARSPRARRRRPAGRVADLARRPDAAVGARRSSPRPPRRPAAEDGTAQVTMRGAVLLRASAAAPLDEEQQAALPRELRAAVDEPRPRAAAELWRCWGRTARALGGARRRRRRSRRSAPSPRR